MTMHPTNYRTTPAASERGLESHSAVAGREGAAMRRGKHSPLRDGCGHPERAGHGRRRRDRHSLILTVSSRPSQACCCFWTCISASVTAEVRPIDRRFRRKRGALLAGEPRVGCSRCAGEVPRMWPNRCSAGSEQPQASRFGNRRRPRSAAELMTDVRDVTVHRMRTHDQLLGDLTVADAQPASVPPARVATGRPPRALRPAAPAGSPRPAPRAAP